MSPANKLLLRGPRAFHPSLVRASARYSSSLPVLTGLEIMPGLLGFSLISDLFQIKELQPVKANEKELSSYPFSFQLVITQTTTPS